MVLKTLTQPACYMSKSVVNYPPKPNNIMHYSSTIVIYEPAVLYC